MQKKKVEEKISKDEQKKDVSSDAKVQTEIKEARTYVYAVGRRKRAIATVRLYPKGKGEILINKKSYQEYFPSFEFQKIIVDPLKTVNAKDAYDISVHVKGGGKRGQAEGIRLGITNALVKLDKELRKALKAKGFLTRDAREKERKKPGLKRARRAPQWSKR